jgi:hypothetical protein
MPEPGRAVRALLGQQIVAGTVQRATDHELAVRIVSDGRVTFPLLARAAVELAEPTPAEAIAEAQAARAAGDALGHALWIAHLVERGLGDDPHVRALFDHR